MQQQSFHDRKYWILVIAILIGMLAGLSYLFEEGRSKNCCISGTVLERNENQVTIQINPEDSDVRIPIGRKPYSFSLSEVTGWKDLVHRGDYIRIPCSSDLTYLFGVYKQSPNNNLAQ